MKMAAKEARALAKIAAKLGALGVAVDVDSIQKEATAHRQTESEKLEAVLASVRRPGDFTYRSCKKCGEPFGANYISVAYCSDLCRIRDFEETTGCKWSAKSQEERWGGEPPLVISPDVVYRMFEYSRTIVRYAETQGWVSPEGTLQPDFLELSATQSNQPSPNPSQLNQAENGPTIALSQPVQTKEFVLQLPAYLDDGY